MLREEHIQFRELIPFLRKIPDNTYFSLDTSEWLLPMNDVEKNRQNLESITGHYVMTYKPHVFARHIHLNQHLCSNIEGAQLSAYETQVLHRAEQNSGVNFVVYKKPLKFISPELSPLAVAYAYLGNQNLFHE